MRELKITELEESKKRAQLRLAEMPVPNNPESRQLSAQISTIDRILNGHRNGIKPRQAIMKKMVMGKIQQEFIKKKQRYL